MDDKWNSDQVKRGVASAVDTATDLVGKAQTAAAEAGGAIRDAAGSDTVKQVSDAVAKTYKQAAESVSHNTAEQPLLALLIAGAVGFGIAYMIFRR
jgi:ElaB/YqjD/DUF883 family membrane-anchored ribosome-binding protein